MVFAKDQQNVAREFSNEVPRLGETELGEEGHGPTVVGPGPRQAGRPVGEARDLGH